MIEFVGNALIRHVQHVPTPPQQNPGLPVLTKDVVFLLPRRRAPNLASLFANVGHVERNSPLTLCVVQDGVRYLEGHHLVHAVENEEVLERMCFGEREEIELGNKYMCSISSSEKGHS